MHGWKETHGRKCVKKKKPRGRPGSSMSDLFDWCTSVFSSLGPAHFLALFLLRYTAVDPFVHSPYIHLRPFYTPLDLPASATDKHALPRAASGVRPNHKFRSSTRTLMSHGRIHYLVTFRNQGRKYWRKYITVTTAVESFKVWCSMFEIK